MNASRFDNLLPPTHPHRENNLASLCCLHHDYAYQVSRFCSNYCTHTVVHINFLVVFMPLFFYAYWEKMITICLLDSNNENHVYI